MNLQNQHLSEESFNDLFIGLPAPEAEAHLAVCEECRARVASFRSDLSLFNEATLAWSKSKTAAIPALRRRARFIPAHPLAWSAAAAALLVAVAASWSHYRAPAPSAVSDPTIAAEFADSPDQIADDNQLLRNVYDAIDEEPGGPLTEFSTINGSSDVSSKARTQ